MNPYQMPVVCSICGGEGNARYGQGHPWINDFVHKDPRDCRYYLEIKAKGLKETEKELGKVGS